MAKIKVACFFLGHGVCYFHYMIVKLLQLLSVTAKI